MPTNNKAITEIRPDSLPTIEAFGFNITIPTSSINTLLLTLLCIIKVKEVLEASTNGLKIAFTALDRIDIAIIDAMDDLAVEMREITHADRCIFFLMHNGLSNQVYHWKRISAMSESIKIGIQPIIKQMQSVLIPSIVTEADYNLYHAMQADKHFIYLHLDNPLMSRKHRNFLLESGTFGQYVRVLVDEETNKPYGAVAIQYSTREQCDINEGTGWSQLTLDNVEIKLDRLYNLLAKRTETKQFRLKSWLLKLVRFGKNK